jgi:hypothetical protein
MLDDGNLGSARRSLVREISLNSAVPSRNINPICVAPYTKTPHEAIVALKTRNRELIEQVTALSKGFVDIEGYTTLREMENAFIENYCLACAHAKFFPFIIAMRLGLCGASWMMKSSIFLKIEAVLGNFADTSVVEIARFCDASFRPEELGETCTKIVLSSRNKTASHGIGLLTNFCKSLTKEIGDNPLYTIGISVIETFVKGFISVSTLMSAGLGIENILDNKDIPKPALDSTSGFLTIARNYASSTVDDKRRASTKGRTTGRGNATPAAPSGVSAGCAPASMPASSFKAPADVPAQASTPPPVDDEFE